jgi:hypothetical protein
MVCKGLRTCRDGRTRCAAETVAASSIRVLLNGVGCVGLSLCVDNCNRHACSATHNDNFLCANTLRPVADCEALNPNKSCFELQLDFGKNGFVR